MNILITGAAGQIGYSLLHKLIDAGHLCMMTDQKRLNINDFHKKSAEYAYDKWNYNHLTTNLSSPYASEILYEQFGDRKIDTIIHLAAITSLPECEANSAQAFNTNVGGTANVLDFARKAGIPHVIFASTSAVYENNKEQVFTEDLAVSPKLFYSQSKKMAEDLIDSYRANYGMNITTLRLFNVFGPDGDAKRLHPPLLNHLVREFKKHGKTTLSGDGTQARDFVHIDDIVSAITACLHKKPNDTINICSGVLTSVKDFAASVVLGLEDCGLTNLEIDYKPANRLWDAYPALFGGNYPLSKEVVTFETNKRSLGSNSKAKKLLDWSPNLDIHALIRKSAIECYHKL